MKSGKEVKYMKNIVISVLAGVAVCVLLYAALMGFSNGGRAEAHALQCKVLNAECSVNDSNHPCCSGLVCQPFNQHSGNGKCGAVTPTTTPTLTVTPTEIPTPTPTEGPKKCEEDCVIPPPTPEVTPTEAPHQDNGGGPSFAPSSTLANPPVCNGDLAGKPLLQGLERDKNNTSVVHLSWWPGEGADHYSLVFWYYGDDVKMGQVNIGNTTQFDITGLKNKPINAEVWAWKGECATKSDTVDP
jgi:hypothetical protein